MAKQGGRKAARKRTGARATTSPFNSDIENGALSSRQTPSTEASKPIRKRAPKKEQNYRITDFYEVRRSHRRPGSELKTEANNELIYMIEKETNEPKLEVYMDYVKGRGIKTRVPFQKGEFVIEYKGNIIPYSSARTAEEEYRQDEDIGSFMYFFEHKNKKWCVDATVETPYKGRLINHSRLHPNLKTRVLEINGKIHLYFIALRDIGVGEELHYDYGDRSAEAALDHPWLVNS